MRVLFFGPMTLYTISFTMLVLCAACTFKRTETTTRPAREEASEQGVVPAATPILAAKKSEEKESQRMLQWFEQMDAIFRESLWVIRQERAPQGKSIFGKMQRALLVDMKQKLANKSLFRCDVYSVTRNLNGPGGVPQTAEVFHQCNSKERFIKIGDWSHAKSDELEMNFSGVHLSEVLGFATGVLSPRIACKLKSNENGLIESFSCEGLMIDYNPAKNQVLRFNRYEYRKHSQKMLHIKAEVLENLDPVKRIEVDIPLEGKITVRETVLQQPEFVAKPVPAAAPVPAVPETPKEAISAEDIYHERNGKEIDRYEEPQSRGVREQNQQGNQDLEAHEEPRDENTR